MRKKQKQALLLVALAVLAVLAIGNRLPMSVVGGTLISVGETVFNSNDPNGFLVGPIFVFTMRQGGLGQHATGIAEAEDIEADGYKVKKGFKLEMESVGENCSYPITVDYSGDKIYTFQTERGSVLLTCPLQLDPTNCITNFCKTSAVAKGRALATINLGYLQDAFRCVYKIPVTSYSGNLRTVGIYEFSSKFKLTVDGKSPVEKTISNVKSGSTANLGNIALIKWLGNLTSGEGCPSPTTYNVKALYKNGVWRLINSNNWNSYRQAAQTVMSSRNYDEAQLLDYVNTANSKATQAQSPITFSPFVGTNTTSLNSGSYKIDLDKQLQFPLFTFYVKASELQFFQPVARARIDSVTATDFKTGEKGSLEIKFTNISDIGANFLLYAECSGDFAMTGTEAERYVGGGKQTAVFLPITGHCDETTSSVCTVSVDNQLGNIVTRNATIKCGPQVTCTARQKSCVENKIMQCSDDGVKWVTLKDCGLLTCGYDDGGNIACVGDDVIECPPGTVPRTSTFLLWETRECVPEVDWYIVLAVVLMIVGGLAFGVFATTRGGKSKKKPRRRRRKKK